MSYVKLACRRQVNKVKYPVYFGHAKLHSETGHWFMLSRLQKCLDTCLVRVSEMVHFIAIKYTGTKWHSVMFKKNLPLCKLNYRVGLIISKKFLKKKKNFKKITSIQVPCIFYCSVKWPTKAQLQLIYKLSHSYMFRHCRVILRELVISTSPSYTSISNAAVGNTI